MDGGRLPSTLQLSYLILTVSNMNNLVAESEDDADSWQSQLAFKRDYGRMLPLCIELVSLLQVESEIKKEMLEAENDIQSFMAHLKAQKGLGARHFDLITLL